MITKTHIYKAHHQFHLSLRFSVGSSGKVAIRRSFLPRGGSGIGVFCLGVSLLIFHLTIFPKSVIFFTQAIQYNGAPNEKHLYFIFKSSQPLHFL